MKNLWNGNNYNLDTKYFFKSLKTRRTSIRDIMTEVQSYEEEEALEYEVEDSSVLENNKCRANKCRP